MIISGKIQDSRKKQGLSQEKLAEALNVSRQTISNWETGATTPPAAKLLELRSQLGISVPELLGEKPMSADAPKGENQKPTEGPMAKKRFLAACILSVCILVAAVAACIGIYMVNLKVDNLMPEDTAIPIERLEDEEVSFSSFGHVDFDQPQP